MTPGWGRFPWRREWPPTPVFLPGEYYGPRKLVGCSPWGCEEWDTTERLTLSLSLGFPGRSSGKESVCQCRKCETAGSVPRSGSRRAHLSAPVFLPEESHGQRSPASYTQSVGLQSRTRLKQLSTASIWVLFLKSLTQFSTIN